MNMNESFDLGYRTGYALGVEHGQKVLSPDAQTRLIEYWQSVQRSYPKGWKDSDYVPAFSALILLALDHLEGFMEERSKL